MIWRLLPLKIFLMPRRKLFSLIASKLFFLPQEFFVLQQDVFPYFTKKNLGSRGKYLATRKQMFCHHQEKISWHQKPFLWVSLRCRFDWCITKPVAVASCRQQPAAENLATASLATVKLR